MTVPRSALILFDHDGLSAIVETKKLYAPEKIAKKARCFMTVEGIRYKSEILDLSDDEDHLEERDLEWSITDRAQALQSERDVRKKGKRSQKYGGYLDIVPPEKSTNLSDANASETTKQKTRGSWAKRKDMVQVHSGAKMKGVKTKTKDEGLKETTNQGKETDNSKLFSAEQRIQSFKVNISPGTIKTAGSNLAWIVNYDTPKMCLYNDRGTEVRSLTIKEIRRINDVAITRSGDLVLLCDYMEVRRVTVDDNISTIIKSEPFNCIGVCVRYDDDIVVSMKARDEQNNHLAVYSNDGHTKLREIRAMDNKENNVLTDPFHLVQNGSDICVVNYYKNVVCLCEESRVKWIFDGTHSGLEYPFDPLGICADKHRNLLVCDTSNNCVHYIDGQEGGFLRLILTYEETGLICPFGIAVDDVAEQVWVGHGAEDVLVAKYLE